MNHIVSGVEVHQCWSCHSAANTLQAMKQNVETFEPHKFANDITHLVKEVPQDMVSHPNLMFTNKQDIKHFLFLLTFSYHWETSYEPHCTTGKQCCVKFTNAGHVILQLILYKLWSKTLLWAFEPHKLPILTSQLHLAWRGTPRYGVTPLPYL